MDGSLLAVLAAHQNNLVTSKTMTSQVVQYLLQMSRKVDFRSESVNPGTKLLMNAFGKELVG